MSSEDFEEAQDLALRSLFGESPQKLHLNQSSKQTIFDRPLRNNNMASRLPEFTSDKSSIATIDQIVDTKNLNYDNQYRYGLFEGSLGMSKPLTSTQMSLVWYIIAASFVVFLLINLARNYLVDDAIIFTGIKQNDSNLNSNSLVGTTDGNNELNDNLSTANSMDETAILFLLIFHAL